MAELLAKASMAKAAASKVALATGLHANVGMAMHPSIDVHSTPAPSGGHCGTGSVTFHPTEHTHIGVTGSGCYMPDGHGGSSITGPMGSGQPLIDFHGGFDF
jgi:hypothetical protein